MEARWQTWGCGGSRYGARSSRGGLQACRRGGTDVWSAGVGSSSHTGRIIAGIWHRQVPGLSQVLRALEVLKQVCLPRIDLSVRVLFTILAIVVGRALAGAYGSGFDLCLTGRL